jgi:chemotaxis family two-component system response regulator Rcp1
MKTHEKKELNILLVEDDPFDAAITKKYIERTGIHYVLQEARDGLEALKSLHKQGPESLPDVVVLDFQLPKISGREIFLHMKRKPDLSHIPVFLLTGRTMQEDPMKSWGLLENCYLNKWLDMEKFLSVLKAIEDKRKFEQDQKEPKERLEKKNDARDRT